ncbi:transporter substrate-binding protein [Synechococcus sp. MIT S1220]|uniref:transporter substrate-binding protein n=1 Tax=Synechococcus sp. MIT S1220 TaxID=3082549 RepID=UPI0039AEBA0F
MIHSLTGTMAVEETGLVEAEMMAIAEINANGGNSDQQTAQSHLTDPERCCLSGQNTPAKPMT